MTATRGPSHPADPAPATVGDMSRYRNTTAQPLVFDAAGHQVDAFGIAEVDANDKRSARHIAARRLVLVPGPVQFLEPSPAEETPEPVEKPEAEPAENSDAETSSDTEAPTTTKRTRSTKKES